jgi:S-adenosylmethionine:tRNA ribosyltransferase-isomerase
VKTDDFDYTLPDRLIASHPAERRDASRMLVVHRATGTLEHRSFRDFPTFFSGADLVVLNNTRVVPARFFSPDGRLEILRLEPGPDETWRCMVKPGKRFRQGDRVSIGGSTATVCEVCADGTRWLRFEPPLDPGRDGHLALPPYMKRGEDTVDRERYQTVYASREGAIAAPTAGLHFTPEILERVNHRFVTLHVGAGTFLPVKATEVSEHKMHVERFEVSDADASVIAGAERVIAVGTTVVRVLEHLAAGGGIRGGAGETSIFIYPPYAFRRVNGLLTNFHLPKSTLLMLVSALAGRDLILEAYHEAIREEYRFYSYGDCMLIL